MAESAGVVNHDGLDDDAVFREAMSASSDVVQAIALAVRALVFEVYPETVEVVWPKQGSVGWGVGPKKFTEQFAYFMPFKKHVTLGFYHGGELPNPDGLLPSSGGTQAGGKLSMRSLKLAKPEAVDRSDLRELVAAAVRHQMALVGDGR
ncbi:MAG: DUF1801 domain-containing protein [Rhodococcus sp.]|nr:DUF1801 domain-containing protein [Rhodococcus sp. (in: high G+C Gram-positive bacteria)]